jgi:hypothetical protein
MALDSRSLYTPLRTAFLKAFGRGGDNGAVVDSDEVKFCFDMFPQPFSAAACRTDAKDANSYSPARARQLVSTQLVNRVSHIDGLYQVQGVDEVGPLYQFEILEPARLKSSAADSTETSEDQLAAFGRLKEAARAQIEKFSVADSIDGVPTTFLACDAQPLNWYDHRETTLWTAYAEEIKGSTPSPGARPASRGVWRRIDSPKLSTLVTAPPLRVMGPPRALTAAHLVVPPAARPAVHVASPPVRLASSRSPVHAAIARSLPKPAVRTVLARPDAELLLRRSVATTPVKTNSVQIAFKYMVVRVERPWLFQPFLRSRAWYVPGFQADDLSGKPSGKGGRFGAIPIGFVLVKDLTITGNWSSGDLDQMNHAYAFGPFGVDGKAALDGATLKSPGIQVVAWINQLMRNVPPQSDPIPEPTTDAALDGSGAKN